MYIYKCMQTSYGWVIQMCYVVFVAALAIFTFQGVFLDMDVLNNVETLKQQPWQQWSSGD